MSEKVVQEYLYNGEYVTITNSKVGNDDLVIVQNDNRDLIVAYKSNLEKKEDSWVYKRAEERAAELRKITAKAQEDLDAIVEKVIEKATSALASRMKFNAVFGKDMGNSAGWAVQIADELGKLVKEKAKDVVEKKEFPF